VPAYVIADVREVRDVEALLEYRRRNTEAVARHGGRFLVRGGEATVLEGDWPTLRIVVIEFPDAAAARGWYESEDYQPLKALRQGASDTNILLVDGGGQG
jgi:uncharacterized protein (DUF1330 family)